MNRLLLCIILVLICACQRSGPLDLEQLAAKVRLGDAAAAEELVGLLAVNDNGLNDKAYPLVLDVGQAIVPPLLAAIKSEDVEQRERVIAALGTLRVPDAAEPVAAVLSATNLGRRYIAAWALGEIGSESSVKPLIAALDDDEDLVRNYATRALIKFNRRAVEPLISHLDSSTPRSAAAALRVLGDIGDKQALDAVLAQAGDVNRVTAFQALGKLRDPRAEAVLIAGLSDPSWRARMQAAMALGTVGSKLSIEPLKRSLEDEVMVVREWSARTLSVLTGNSVRYRDEQGELVEPYSVYH